MTLMALYGQKASAMEEQGKLNKDLRRRLEAERQKRHDRGEYSGKYFKATQESTRTY